MTLTGMNPAEVRQLAEQLRHSGEQLRSIVSQVDGRITHSSWAGRDAEIFKHQWWPAHRRALLQAAESVSGLGQSARNNADEQERVSSVDGSNGGGLPPVAAPAAVSDTIAPTIGDRASATSPPSTAPSSAGVEAAVAWAQNVQATDPTSYDQQCLNFVAKAWASSGNNSLFGYYNPQAFIAAHGGQLQHSFPPPAGAAVFWGADSWNEDGHVELSLGDGTAISTSSADGTGIHISDIAARNRTKSASYAGWLAL